MSLLKKLAGETAIYGIGSVLPRFINFIVLTPFLTIIFNEQQDQYGVYTLMYSFSVFMMIILTYRMETAFFRFGSKAGQLEKTFSTACIALLVTTFIGVELVLLFSSSISNLISDSPENAIYVGFITVITGLDVLCAIPYARLRLENRPIRFAIIKIINVIITLGTLLFLLKALPILKTNGIGWADFYNKNDQLDYVFIANLVGSALVLVMLLPQYFKIKWQFDKALFKKMLLYAWPLIIVGLAGAINGFIDRILIVKLTPESGIVQAGIYGACVKIAVLMQLFTQAFNYAAEPFFFKHADRSDAKKIYAQVGEAFTVVGSLAFLGIMLYIDIIQYLIGSNFREGLAIVPILLIAYIFQGLYYNFSIWYKITDRTIFGGYISVGGSIIVLSMNFLLIPVLGYIASAWTSLACFAFMASASYAIGRKYYPVPYPIISMLAYIITAIIAYFLSEFIRPFLPNLISILAVNTFIIGAYIVGIWKFKYNDFQQMLK